jgi:hypothetical protein
MLKILYFNEDQFKSMLFRTILSLQDLTFDKATHFIEDTKLYCFVFDHYCEGTVREILASSNPELEVSFESINIPS